MKLLSLQQFQIQVNAVPSRSVQFAIVPTDRALLTLISRVTFTSMMIANRQRVCDGAWFGLVRFVPRVGSRPPR
jgi:hypothetical protein